MLEGQLQPGGVGEVPRGEVDPVAGDQAVRVGRRFPGEGHRGIRHVQDGDVSRRLRNWKSGDLCYRHLMPSSS